MSAQSKGTMPSEITRRISFFDKFATHVNKFVSRAWFFSLCAVLVVLWAPSYFLFDTVDTWQLVINTVTTIVTFLLVALLQNTQTRSDEATQHKLNAIAAALADLMHNLDSDSGDQKLRKDASELRKAVGLENRESS